MAAAAEEKKEAPAPEAAPEPSGGGGGNKLVLILTAVNVLVTLGMVAILYVSFQRDKKQASVADFSAEGEHEAEGEGHGGGGGEHGAKEGGHGVGGLLKHKTADFGKMVTLEQFSVNLAMPGSGAPKFVRVNISLELPTDDAEAEVTSKMPQVRNAIIDLFNSKRPSDLASAEGRDYLKEEIKNALNGFLVVGKVRGVFFTNFVVTS